MKQAYDTSGLRVTPTFDVETDFLGHHHLSPPAVTGSYGGYYPKGPNEGRIALFFLSLGWGLVLAVLSLVPGVVANVVFNNEGSFDSRYGRGEIFEYSMRSLLSLVGALTLGTLVGIMIQYRYKGSVDFGTWAAWTFLLGIAAAVAWMVYGLKVAEVDVRSDGRRQTWVDPHLLVDAVPPIAAAVGVVLVLAGLVGRARNRS